MDYDKLLSKYAMAELTIDQLRLGAKITLHSDSPTPSQATIGSLPGAQQQQMFQLLLWYTKFHCLILPTKTTQIGTFVHVFKE
jgi:hypothetical protein